MARFRVIRLREAQEKGFYKMGKWEDEWELGLWDFKDESNPILIATDEMQPEDVSFYRDLAWVPEIMNKLAEGKF